MINDVSALTYDPRSPNGRGSGRAGRPDAPPGRSGDDAGRPALRRRAGRGLSWLEERIAFAEADGIARDRILVDPGFGFGKTVAHNSR